MTATNSARTSSDNRFLAAILTKGCRAIAAEAASRLLESEPAAREGFGSDPFASWQCWLSTRVEELASAISLNRPQVFIGQVLWARSALAPRGIDLRHFRRGLVFLGEAMREELPENVRALVSDYIEQALQAFDAAGKEPPAAAREDEPFCRMITDYLLAVLEGDGRRAIQTVVAAADRGHPIHDLYLRVLVPAQKEIGRMWLANELTIADEHLSSVTARRLMSRLVCHAPAAPANGKTIVVASVVGNRHDLGTQVVADFFEMDGWRTIELGADVPACALVEMLDSANIDLLCLSAALPVQLPAVRDTIAAVRRTMPGSTIKILVGGRAWEGSADLARQLGADDYAANAQEAVRLGRQLMGMD